MTFANYSDLTGRVVGRWSGGGGGGSQPQTGTGPPGAGDGNVTPDGIGALYVDTSAGGLYIAVGTTSADWRALGGNTSQGSDLYPGVSSVADLIAICQSGTGVQFSDQFVTVGFGNRLSFFSPGLDGQQVMFLQLGNAGQFTHSWAADGTYTAPNGVIFPTADPLVAGAWWDNAGVLTKSAGPPP